MVIVGDYELWYNIGQLAKLIFEQPQGSLPSNIESNPREQINAITIQDAEGLVAPEPEPSNTESNPREQLNTITTQDKEGLVEPASEPRQGVVKLRTPDKLKLDQDELNVAPNQLKVGDKVLLDAANPRIATSEPNEEIPLTVLSIFPYGTVEVIHPKFGTFKVNNTRLKPYVDKVDSRDEECKLLAPP
ncbi:hypothetical protein GOBAR_AA14386 [Gossypium barbadense]|uniref:Uncharacterized protein n=1 Tax=Gossypium barbadense TaxID=3634 RepID=A0A2P5XSK0_GOSBA|nr:hypothetical protein GOBAR_AA14386 [Gossypium barbadense]